MSKLSSTHACAIRGCEKIISRRLLMCPEHWRMVPKILQNNVWITWKKGGAKQYLAARQAAINSVEVA